MSGGGRVEQELEEHPPVFRVPFLGGGTLFRPGENSSLGQCSRLSLNQDQISSLPIKALQC